MTTASTHSRTGRPPGAAGLWVAALAGLAAGAVLAGIGGIASGETAALSAAAGAGLVVVVVGFGVFVLNTIASVMPGATVLVALVTYTLQMVVLAAVTLQLVRSEMLEDTLDRRWFGGAIALATAVWAITQIVAHTKARIPVYDLPEADAR